MIKVVHIQKHLPSSGNAAFRLHSAMLEAGIDSSMLSLSSDLNGDERIKHLNLVYQIISFFDGKILSYLTRKAEKKYGLFSFPVLGLNIARNAQIKKADIIYLHWINGGFLNLYSIKKIAKLNKPVVFFMHDMWTITGGCHHSFQCEKYKTQCRNCQVFSRHKKNDLSKIEFTRKVKLFSRFNNLYFIAPSKWLYNCATQSKITFDKPSYYIPNVVDNKLFKPFDKTIAKQILNIDINATIISFGAISINSPYKGWTLLRDALNILGNKFKREKVIILIFGSSGVREISNYIPFETRFMGKMRDDLSISLIYNASDVFIAPSLAETFGLVIAESLSCGTPVVGFDVGGIPDLIQHKINGYLAKYGDAKDLACGIEYCLENKVKGSLLTMFNPSNVVRKHLDLFESIKSW